MGELLDVLREAEAHARVARASQIGALHVSGAIEARRRRHDLAERKTQELLDQGLLVVDTTGRRTGQVNALAVYDTLDHVFARPARVSAAVAIGREGVIDIEREASLSGDSHHKGIQILSGFLRSRYAQERPLCLTASVCFEQSYAPIDGDSASVAEVAAILSALADVPVEQSWAATGSMNQLGDVQAIGDVNEKVEGFFQVCTARGLTGAQGVVVPASNLGDLMLREDVIEAVAAGRFHVKTARTIEDVLEVITGRPRAELHERVATRLAALALAARHHAPPFVLDEHCDEGS
jgi:predicted ATP-dependent protease